jgi:hypothetical protein
MSLDSSSIQFMAVNRILAAQSNCQGNASFISHKNLAQANDRFSVQVSQLNKRQRVGLADFKSNRRSLFFWNNTVTSYTGSKYIKSTTLFFSAAAKTRTVPKEHLTPQRLQFLPRMQERSRVVAGGRYVTTTPSPVDVYEWPIR